MTVRDYVKEIIEYNQPKINMLKRRTKTNWKHEKNYQGKMGESHKLVNKVIKNKRTGYPDTV